MSRAGSSETVGGGEEGKEALTQGLRTGGELLGLLEEEGMRCGWMAMSRWGSFLGISKQILRVLFKELCWAGVGVLSFGSL